VIVEIQMRRPCPSGTEHHAFTETDWNDQIVRTIVLAPAHIAMVEHISLSRDRICAALR
jgi:hypothetical protein